MQNRIIYVSMGDEVRKFSGRGPMRYFRKHMHGINSQAKLQPSIFPIFFFLSKVIRKYSGDEIIIINGSPRSKEELFLWKQLIDAEYLPPATIINLEVSDDECRKRLITRGRSDSSDPEKLNTKLDWYKPVRKMLSEELPEGFDLVTIDGEKDEKLVFQDLQDFFKKELQL